MDTNSQLSTNHLIHLLLNFADTRINDIFKLCPAFVRKLRPTRWVLPLLIGYCPSSATILPVYDVVWSSRFEHLNKSAIAR